MEGNNAPESTNCLPAGRIGPVNIGRSRPSKQVKSLVVGVVSPSVRQGIMRGVENEQEGS